MEKNKRIKFLIALKNHILNNRKDYTIVSLIFVIGIFLGVFFVNNMQESKITEVNSYFNDSINKLKEVETIESFTLLKENIIEKILLATAIWFFGTTVIGIPIVFGMVLYRGFCFGYTIAISVTSLGIIKGLIFICSSLFLQNILFISAILALAVSGFKLYKSIIKSKDKENIKVEILRHTVFSFVMLIILIFSSVIETYISTNILKLVIKYV